jgi:hypothetical protein
MCFWQQKVPRERRHGVVDSFQCHWRKASRSSRGICIVMLSPGIKRRYLDIPGRRRDT